jgi:hypothetical protein
MESALPAIERRPSPSLSPRPSAAPLQARAANSPASAAGSSSPGSERLSRAGAFRCRPPRTRPTSRRSPGPRRPATRSAPDDRSTAPRHSGSALSPPVSSNPDATTPWPLSSARSPLGPRQPPGRVTPLRRTAAPCGDRPHTFTTGPTAGYDDRTARADRLCPLVTFRFESRSP